MKIANIAKYLNKKLVFSYRTEGELLVTDGRVIVEIPFEPQWFPFKKCSEEVLTPYAPKETNQTVRVLSSGEKSIEKEANLQESWKKELEKPVKELLTPTRYLYEGWSDTHRRMQKDTGGYVWVPERLLKLFETRLDYLKGFRFELIDGCTIRVSKQVHPHGFDAYWKPIAHIIHSEIEVQGE